MAWRIHFTADDLARTRVAPTLGPLAETLLGFSMLRGEAKLPNAFSGWREDVRPRLSPAMRPLAAVIPGGHFGVDLWSLTGEAPTIDQGLRALVAMRPEHVRAELEYYTMDMHCPLSSEAWRIADHADRGRQILARAAQATHAALVEPYWPRVHAHLHAERVSRSRLLLDGGVERLFETISPCVRWRSPVLEIDVRHEHDVRLDGRGFELVPSMFIGDRPLLLLDLANPATPARFLFSAARDGWALSHGAERDGRHSGSLAALMGRTRAAALGRIAHGCSTSELAHYLGVSVAGASQHATVLRDNGLIVTRREGSAVLHTITTLGVEMLRVNGSHNRDLDWNLFS